MDLDKDVSESNWNGNVYSIILRVVTYVYLFLLSFRTYSYNFAFLYSGQIGQIEGYMATSTTSVIQYLETNTMTIKSFHPNSCVYMCNYF